MTWMILALCFPFLYCTGIFDGHLLTSNTACILERKDKYRQGFYFLDTQDCDSNHLKRNTLRNGSLSPMPKNQCSQITQSYKFNVHAAQQTGCSVSCFTRFSLKHSQSVQLILWPHGYLGHSHNLQSIDAVQRFRISSLSWTPQHRLLPHRRGGK